MKVSQANRGMGLETLINYANEQYAVKRIANIKKVATPWKVVRDMRGRIINAFPEGPSTVDFMGEYQGKAICFEAKQTKNKTSFPLSNFEEHQIEFMRSWQGEKFAIIEFTEHNEIYYLPWIHLLNWWHSDERKSIPYSFFRKRWLVGSSNGVVLDYLKFIEVKEEAVWYTS